MYCELVRSREATREKPALLRFRLGLQARRDSSSASLGLGLGLVLTPTPAATIQHAYQAVNRYKIANLEPLGESKSDPVGAALSSFVLLTYLPSPLPQFWAKFVQVNLFDEPDERVLLPGTYASNLGPALVACVYPTQYFPATGVGSLVTLRLLSLGSLLETFKPPSSTEVQRSALRIKIQAGIQIHLTGSGSTRARARWIRLNAVSSLPSYEA
ncbi:hypothetical protein B0H13DRAFT_1916902 [Mycena leptocephala]|nr:hypothetical protein B0H13DRAFT_1916902 [Mycena leptocephala]